MTVEIALEGDVMRDIGFEGSGCAISRASVSLMTAEIKRKPLKVEQRACPVPGVTDVQVDVVCDPPWDPSRMSEASRLELGLL